MSCRIISRKVDDGQVVGYLLEQEGLRFIVELRDLYEQEILESLIESGYEYHDYYGDITTKDGIAINELSAEPITPDDNLSFKGAFAQQALTEQQALRYFRTNMSNIVTVQFREPVKILIHNRDELIQYLRKWKYVNSTRTTIDCLYPLNAICAKEALFTPDEIETDANVRDVFQWMANRRRYPTYETLRQIQDFFIEEGIMEESERDNIDSFIKCYAMWGPEGVDAACIGQKFEYDVIYQIGVPYTGTGREKLTFESVKAALRADVKDDILSQINYRISLGIMDKEGCITSGDYKVDREDVIEHDGDILLTQDMMRKYNELSRSTGKWETAYRALNVIDIIHQNRLCLTLQTPEGRLYEWRMDKNNIALVNTNNAIYIQPTGTVMSIDGKVVRIDRMYEKEGYAKYAMFHRIAEEVIDTKRTVPPYRSTSELCVKNGLHAEQALDYIQFMSGRAEATSILHYGVDDLFMKRFGAGVDDLGADADFIDVLELLQTNYNDALTAEGPEHFDYSEVLDNILDSSASPEDKKLAMYINNNRPDLKISAILDFNSDKIALEQADGRSFDNSNSNEERVYVGLMSLYTIICGKEMDQTKVGQFFEDVMSEKYMKIDDMVPNLGAEAHGCLVDYATLKFKQMREVNSCIWVTSVIGEYSAAPIAERRHIGFAGVKMDLSKGTKMRKIVDALMASVDRQMLTSGLYADKDKTNYGRILGSHILEFLWGIKIGNIALENKDDMFYKTYTQKTKYNMSVSVTLALGSSDYHYITSPNCPDFSYALSTIATFCRNSTVTVSNNFRFDSMLMNVNISPWRITQRQGYEDVLVYNGCLNLITMNQWETFFKQNMQAVYNGVMQERGRMDLNPYDLDNTYAVYPVNATDSTMAAFLFKEINEEHGRKGTDLPIEYNTYYLDNNDKDECFRSYMQRINNTLELCNRNHVGKKFYRAPLKSDFYYSNIASYYNEEVITDYEVVDVSFTGVASKPYAPAFTGQFAKNLIGTVKGQINVVPIANADLTVDKLLRCNSLVKYGFAPRFNCYVGTGTIFVLDKDKTVLNLDNMTIDDLIKYASVGMCYQISATEFLFYGVNGTFVLEVV